MSKTEKKISGVIVPMITPFTDSGEIDIHSAKKLTEYLVSAETSPFVLGTTGESLSIPDEFRIDLVKTVVETTAGRTLTYAGISSNCLKNSINFANRYSDIGIDIVVAHVPTYYPLCSDHILKYYETLADSIQVPLVLYNIPITTHISLSIELIKKLSYHPRIVGYKDSVQDIERLESSANLWVDRDDFSCLIGWAAQSAYGLKLGADGIVPSPANIIPHLFKQLFDYVHKSDLKAAEILQNQINEISSIFLKDRTVTQSISALKVIMNELDFCEPNVLPPLLNVSEKEKLDIQRQLSKVRTLLKI